MRKNKLTTYIVYITLFIYILTYPIYIWSSGIPQIGDFIGIILIILVLLQVKKIKLNRIMIISLILLFYITIVNLVWGIILNEHINSFMSSSWYIYNIFIMFIFIIVIQNYSKTLDVIKYAVITTIIIQFTIVMIVPNPNFRAIGTFNNPNQLAYFILLYLILFYLLNKIKPVNNFIFWSITFAGVIITLYSLSKATIISVSILVLIEILIRIKKESKIKLIIILIIISTIGIKYEANIESFINENQMYQNVKERMLSIGTRADDNPAGRGYDRIYNQPEYLILGAGEVAVERFDSFDAEIHSTIGNILFSYGIIGLMIFLILILNVIKNNKLTTYYLLIPIILYSLTHNGIRSPIFWSFLALLYLYNKMEERENENYES